MLTQTPIQNGALRPIGSRNAGLRPPVGSHVLAGSIELMGAPMSFSRNAEIYGENEPGDIFGLETGEEHSFSAEAITDAKVLVVKRSVVVALAARDNDVARQLWALTGRELERVQHQMLLLIKTAQERVASFLIEMADRIAPSGMASSGEVQLPMSRQDIADYLGLTIETVSRTLTQFEHATTISLPTSRRIVLRNRSALMRLMA